VHEHLAHVLHESYGLAHPVLNCACSTVLNCLLQEISKLLPKDTLEWKLQLLEEGGKHVEPLLPKIAFRTLSLARWALRHAVEDWAQPAVCQPYSRLGGSDRVCTV